MAGGYSFANVRLGVDLEVVATCVKSEVSTASKQTFIGGQFVWTGSAAFVMNAGSNHFRLVNPNLGVAGTVVSGAQADNPRRVRLIRRAAGPPQKRPSFGLGSLRSAVYRNSMGRSDGSLFGSVLVRGCRARRSSTWFPVRHIQFPARPDSIPR
jgi:hypothetical protein